MRCRLAMCFPVRLRDVKRWIPRIRYAPNHTVEPLAIQLERSARKREKSNGKNTQSQSFESF